MAHGSSWTFLMRRMYETVSIVKSGDAPRADSLPQGGNSTGFRGPGICNGAIRRQYANFTHHGPEPGRSACGNDPDRKNVGSGKSGAVRVDLGGCCRLKK